LPCPAQILSKRISRGQEEDCLNQHESRIDPTELASDSIVIRWQIQVIAVATSHVGVELIVPVMNLDEQVGTHRPLPGSWEKSRSGAFSPVTE
jgi:hypothetical protein